MSYENNLITHCIIWSQRAELNRRPTDYEFAPITSPGSVPLRETIRFSLGNSSATGGALDNFTKDTASGSADLCQFLFSYFISRL